MAKKEEHRTECCETCRNAKPVTHEYRTHDGMAIFCTCDFVPNYHFLRHNVTHKKCEYYEKSL